jgi:hypothetical protein
MMVSLLPFLDGPDNHFLFLVLALERWNQRLSVISRVSCLYKMDVCYEIYLRRIEWFLPSSTA